MVNCYSEAGINKENAPMVLIEKENCVSKAIVSGGMMTNTTSLGYFIEE